jgi:hypothetical protein
MTVRFHLNSTWPLWSQRDRRHPKSRHLREKCVHFGPSNNLCPCRHSVRRGDNKVRQPAEWWGTARHGVARRGRLGQAGAPCGTLRHDGARCGTMGHPAAPRGKMKPCRCASGQRQTVVRLGVVAQKWTAPVAAAPADNGLSALSTELQLQRDVMEEPEAEEDQLTASQPTSATTEDNAEAATTGQSVPKPKKRRTAAKKTAPPEPPIVTGPPELKCLFLRLHQRPMSNAAMLEKRDVTLPATTGPKPRWSADQSCALPAMEAGRSGMLQRTERREPPISATPGAASSGN